MRRKRKKNSHSCAVSESAIRFQVFNYLIQWKDQNKKVQKHIFFNGWLSFLEGVLDFTFLDFLANISC